MTDILSLCSLVFPSPPSASVDRLGIMRQRHPKAWRRKKDSVVPLKRANSAIPRSPRRHGAFPKREESRPSLPNCRLPSRARRELRGRRNGTAHHVDGKNTSVFFSLSIFAFPVCRISHPRTDRARTGRKSGNRGSGVSFWL